MNDNSHEQLQNVNHSKEIARQGIMQFQSKNYVSALKLFEDALEVFPGSIIASQYRGLCKCLIALTNDPILSENQYLVDAISDFNNVADSLLKIQLLNLKDVLSV